MRRRLGLVAAALVVLMLGAWLAWTQVWPSYRPSLRVGESWGLDVSSYQGVIRWDEVAADGVAAAYVKASEGGDWTDPRFEQNVAGARAAGVEVGAYHFLTLCKPGELQAENFLAMVARVERDRALDLPPVVDLELGGNCAVRPPVQEVNAQVRAFMERVERAQGRPVRLYLLADWADIYPLPADLDRERWVRRLALRPDGDWAWWQVSNRARVAGVDHPVDLNVLRRWRSRCGRLPWCGE